MATNLGTAYVRIEPSAKGIGNEISNILNNEAGGAGEKAGSKLVGGIGSALKVGGAVIGAGIAAATGAVIGFGKEAVSAYASYEQLSGGIETLFDNTENAQRYGNILRDMGNSAEYVAREVEEASRIPIDTVMGNASKAYQTAGMSANDYMETVVGMAAALNNSTGDLQVSAELADMAIQDMSDNANKMGTSLESVQNAYRGFSRGNFTMLDNLSLGFAGTKDGMAELLAAAEEISGVEYDIDSYADIVEAIHVVQDEMGITGTTAKEAMFTIEGSANATKAAWQNVITAVGRGEGMGEAFNGLLTSIFGGEDGGGLLNNIIPRIQQVMEGIGEFVAQASPIIAEKLPALIEGIVPSLLSAGVTLIEGLAQGILTALPVLMPIAVDVLMELVHAIIDNLPMIISVGIQLIGELIIGISQALPELIPAALEAIYAIIDGLLDNIDLLIDAAVQLAIGISVGLVQAIPVIVEKAPEIIGKLVVALIGAIPKLVLAAGQIMVAFVNAILSVGAKLSDAGRQIVDGLKNGIVNAWGNLVNKVKEMAGNLINSVKNVFKISSPSKVFAEMGDYCVQGFDEGFSTFGDSSVAMVEDAMSDIASVGVPSFETDMRVSAGAYRSADTSSDVYGLLAQYLPELVSRDGNVKVVLEGDAQGLFRQVRQQTNQFIKSTGASPFLSPA